MESCILPSGNKLAHVAVFEPPAVCFSRRNAILELSDAGNVMTPKGTAGNKPSHDGVRYPKGYMKPTRERAETIPEQFYELINYLYFKKKITWKKISTIIPIDPTNVERRIANQSLDEDQRKLILDYIYDDAKIILGSLADEIAEIRDNLYFSIIDFFSIKPSSQDNARDVILGTYQLWRHSVENEGEFVHGRVVFEQDDESGAVHVHMTQPRKAKESMRASNEEFHGYFFRIADMYAMMLKDVANDDMRITIFHRYRIEHIGADIDKSSIYEGSKRHIVHLHGFGMGIDGNNLFVSPVYLELVDDRDQIDGLEEKLDVVSENDTPKRVVKMLGKQPKIVR